MEAESLEAKALDAKALDAKALDAKAAELREQFKQFDIRKNPDKYKLEYPDGLLKKASILIPLYYKNGEYWIILTLRSKDLTHHAGYVAFPGGMADKEDKDEIATALRETEEEIGLSPNDVRVIGLFSPGIVKPNSLVYAVIGLVPDNFVPKINEREVSMVFHLPLKRFLSTEGLHVEEFQSPVRAAYHVHHFEDTVDGQIVDTWGITAAYCVMTAIVVLQSDKSFSFYDKFIIDKNTAFGGEGTMDIIRQMEKMVSKM